MRYLFFVVFLFFSADLAHAASDHVTPYGDYSQWCSAYGTCKENLGPKEAEKAILRYFADKRLRAANIQHKGRFIEAEIYDDGSLVDKVLFDRKTGRMRSTY